MKKIYLILLIVILLNNNNLYCQDIIDPPKLIQFETSPVVDRNFNSFSFIIGWNWGTPGAMLDSAVTLNEVKSPGIFPIPQFLWILRCAQNDNVNLHPSSDAGG